MERMADTHLRESALARANAPRRAWERSDTALGRARDSLRGYRWVALFMTVAFGGTAIWFADWPSLTGTLLLGNVMLLTWFAAALSWAGTGRWRRSLAGMIGSVVATAALFLGLLMGVGVLITPYRDRAVPSAPPSIPAPWPVQLGLAVLFIGLFLWGGRRSASR